MYPSQLKNAKVILVHETDDETDPSNVIVVQYFCLFLIEY